MKKYVDYVLRKEKKAISFEKIIEKINKLRQEEGIELKLSKNEENSIRAIIDEGVRSFDIYQTPINNYISMSKTSFRKGRFYGDRSGAGKVSVTTSYVDRNGSLVVNEDKYVISKDKSNGAIDGDFVLIDLGGKMMQPKVVQVLDRQLEYIPGEVYRLGNSYFVKPIDKRKQGITIALEGEAIEGERVAVSLETQTSDNFYIGKIVKKFNHKDDPNEDILWEAFKHGVDNEFSNESLKQLETIPDSLRPCDRIGREDLTNWDIFTIDGADTKDMDDAISCTINEKGNYVLGVHITDVASIIPEGSPLDIDAFNKGNSYYLGGTVLPMTPHKISNGIGSLNPHVDRMTISCIMEISPEGELINYRLTPSIIHSKMKMTYDKVNDLLKDNKVDPNYSDFEDTLRRMSQLALVLRKKRLKNGAVEFNRSELKIHYDNGSISGFHLRSQDVAENLIEEFMLIANEVVDKDLSKKGLPCVHRVHGEPSEEKLIAYLKLLDAVNLPFHKYSASELVENKKAYQKLVEHISKAGRLSGLLSTEAIKCMARAKYSSENYGHYGLAKDHYCHFTSPVRRYADLTVHRVLWDLLFHKGDYDKNRKKWEKRIPEIAEKTSHMEKVADETERDVNRMLCAQYMENHIGEEFDATVTGLSQDCLLVELDNLIEGTVRTRDLKGSYVYSPDSYSLVSLDGRENFFIGDRLHLKLKAASKENKKIEFEVLEKIDETKILNAEAINHAVKLKTKMDRKR